MAQIDSSGAVNPVKHPVMSDMLSISLRIPKHEQTKGKIQNTTKVHEVDFVCNVSSSKGISDIIIVTLLQNIHLSYTYSTQRKSWPMSIKLILLASFDRGARPNCQKSVTKLYIKAM